MEKGDNVYTIIAAIILIIVAGVGGWWLGASQAKYQPNSQNYSSSTTNQSIKEYTLRRTMDTLWDDHITWTRMYIISAVNNLPDKDQALNRLLKNQEDIGDAVKPYYGNDAGNQLTALLKEHIVKAGEVVTAAAKKDDAAFDKANAAWHDNANQIADALALANPQNWSQNDLRAMMKNHLDLTLQEASDIINKKADESINDYDKVHNQILQMSEMLSSGIVKQFPDQF